MSRAALIAALLASALAAAPSVARTTIEPYVEAQQVFSTDLSGHNDYGSETYTGLAAGVDATLDGRHVQGQIDYRYDHYFAWSHRYDDTNTHQGLASIIYQATPEISLDAAGIATRANGGFGRRSAGFLFGNTDNTTQVYAAQIGPSYTDRFGDVSVNADYRFAWTRSSDGQGDFDLGPRQPVFQNNFTTTDHVVDASVGTQPGGLGLPVGLNLSGGWTRTNVHFLDARLDDYYGRLDITVPISSTLAAEGGVGYEKDRASQAAILTDAAGNAVLTDHRHLQADHSKPRLLSYDDDGLIWDVGVIWRPSQRTLVEVRGGKRYDETVITGRIDHQLSANSTVEVVAYDDITSFGRQLTGEIGALPTSFNNVTPPIPTTLGGCVFGSSGGKGGCIPALSSVNSDFYRSRGVYADISITRGLWTYGLGVGYDHRHYLSPDYGPDIVGFAGVGEQSVSIDGVAERQLSRNSSLSFTALARWYDSDRFDDSSYWSYGAAASYYRGFSRHLSGTASISVSSGSGDNRDDDVIGTALVAVRYTL